MVQTAPLLVLTAGATGACPVGGTAQYDSARATEQLVGCRSKQFPEHSYTGSFTVGDLVSNADHSYTTMSISAPSIIVANGIGIIEFVVELGDITGAVNDSNAGNMYSFASKSLVFKAGQTSRYAISNAGSTEVRILLTQDVPDRTTNNLMFSTSNGTNVWQVQAMSPVHESGTARPDRGSLLVTRLGATQALSVSFGTNNTFTLAGGEEGAPNRTFNWSDVAVQAALHEAYK